MSILITAKHYCSSHAAVFDVCFESFQNNLHFQQTSILRLELVHCVKAEHGKIETDHSTKAD